VRSSLLKIAPPWCSRREPGVSPANRQQSSVDENSAYLIPQIAQ
jgi:hypothetical protein